jgi:hypothetical protein
MCGPNRLRKKSALTFSRRKQWAFVQGEISAAPLALPGKAIPTQPFRAGLTFSGRPSGALMRLHPEATVRTSTGHFILEGVRTVQGAKADDVYIAFAPGINPRPTRKSSFSAQGEAPCPSRGRPVEAPGIQSDFLSLCPISRPNLGAEFVPVTFTGISAPAACL